MRRRQFLVGAAGCLGSAVPLLGRAQEKPCPPSTFSVSGGSSAVTQCVAPTGGPAWLQGRGVNEWFQIPNTALSSVEPTLDSIQRAISGPSSKINTWQGAALKRQGSVYMLAACGGHGDYAGNEVEAIALNADSPRWVQLRAPTPGKDIINGSECYLDRRRSATHTYYCQHFSDATNRLILMPAPGMGLSSLPSPPSGWPYGDKHPMAFSLETNDWMAPETYAEMPIGDRSDFTACLAVMHHGTGDVYYARNYDDGRYWKFSPSTGTTSLIGTIWHQNYAGAAIDHTRNRMLLVGDYGGTMAPRVINVTTGASVSASFGGLGPDVLKFGGYPGVVFDEANDRYLVFRNSEPIATYAVNAATWQVSQLATSGSPAARPNGIHNSVQYVPELKGVVVANSYRGNMYFMRVA